MYSAGDACLGRLVTMIRGAKGDYAVALATSADLAEAGGRGPTWLEYLVLCLVLESCSSWAISWHSWLLACGEAS